MNNTGQPTLLRVNIKAIMCTMIAEKVKVKGRGQRDEWLVHFESGQCLI